MTRRADLRTPDDVRLGGRRRRLRRAGIVAFSVVGVGLLGLAAAATSAAWTDAAWFSASTTSAAIELQASLDGTSWSAADGTGTALTIPAATFQNMFPGKAVSYTLYLKNTGNVSLTVVPQLTSAAGLLAGANPVAVSAVPMWPYTLAAGATQTLTMTMTAPNTWVNTDTGYKSATGSAQIRFVGTA
jgi:hypothetical protein